MRAEFVALSLGICLVAAGCGQKSDQNKTTTIAGNGGSVVYSGNGDHMVIKSTNGNATVEYSSTGMVHANMPDFAPLYPGAKVTSSVSGTNTNSNGGSGAMVTFTVPASQSDVIAFYKQKAGAAGLGETMNMDQGNTMMFVAGKEKKSLQVVATKTDSGTQAQVIWGNGE